MGGPKGVEEMCACCVAAVAAVAPDAAGDLADCLRASELDDFAAPLLGENFVSAMFFFNFRTGVLARNVAAQFLRKKLVAEKWLVIPLHLRHHWLLAVAFAKVELGTPTFTAELFDSAPAAVTREDAAKLLKKLGFDRLTWHSPWRQQRGSNECGLFVLAACAAQAAGQLESKRGTPSVTASLAHWRAPLLEASARDAETRANTLQRLWLFEPPKPEGTEGGTGELANHDAEMKQRGARETGRTGQATEKKQQPKQATTGHTAHEADQQAKQTTAGHTGRPADQQQQQAKQATTGHTGQTADQQQQQAKQTTAGHTAHKADQQQQQAKKATAGHTGQTADQQQQQAKQTTEHTGQADDQQQQQAKQTTEHTGQADDQQHAKQETTGHTAQKTDQQQSNGYQQQKPTEPAGREQTQPKEPQTTRPQTTDDRESETARQARTPTGRKPERQEGTHPTADERGGRNERNSQTPRQPQTPTGQQAERPEGARDGRNQRDSQKPRTGQQTEQPEAARDGRNERNSQKPRQPQTPTGQQAEQPEAARDGRNGRDNQKPRQPQTLTGQQAEQPEGTRDGRNERDNQTPRQPQTPTGQQAEQPEAARGRNERDSQTPRQPQTPTGQQAEQPEGAHRTTSNGKQPAGGSEPIASSKAESNKNPTIRETGLYINRIVDEEDKTQNEAAKKPHSMVDARVIRSILGKFANPNKTAEIQVVPPLTLTSITQAYDTMSARQKKVRLNMTEDLKSKEITAVLYVKNHYVALHYRSGVLKVMNSLVTHCPEQTDRAIESVRQWLEDLNGTAVRVMKEETPQQNVSPPGDTNVCAFHATTNVLKAAGYNIVINRTNFDNPHQSEATAPKPEEKEAEEAEAMHFEPKDPSLAERKRGWRENLRQALDEDETKFEAHILWRQRGDPKSKLTWWGGTFVPETGEAKWTHIFMRGNWKRMATKTQPLSVNLDRERNYDVVYLRLFGHAEAYNDETRQLFRNQLMDDVLITGGRLRTLVFTAAPAKGILHATEVEHRTLLHQMVAAAKEERHFHTPIGKLAAEMLAEQAIKEKWKATTLARKANSMIGALQKLPLYTTIQKGIKLVHSAHYKDWHRAVQISAAAARVDFPTAMHMEEYKKIVDRFMTAPLGAGNNALAFIIISWTLAARFGDVCKLQKCDLKLEVKAGEYLVEAVFLRGKTARLGDPHRVTMPLPTYKAREVHEKLGRTFQWRASGEFLVSAPTKTAYRHFYEKSREQLRKVNTQLELRSMRRGRLQMLAAVMKPQDLMEISGHKQMTTLLRYLGWGDTATAKKAAHIGYAVSAEHELRKGELKGGGSGLELPDWWEHIGTTTPSMRELGTRENNAKMREANKTLHIKQVGPFNMGKLDEYAETVGMTEQWTTVSKFIRDPTTHTGTKKTPIRTTRIRPSFVDQMIAHGHVKAAEAEEVKGYMRLFTVAEVEKGRCRAIKHPPEVNDFISKDKLLGVHLPSLAEQIEQVRTADFALELDGAAFFDGFEVHPDIASYQGFKSGSNHYVYTRMLMGVRYAVDVAQTAMKILARYAIATAYQQTPTRNVVTEQTNVDNVRFAGDEEAVRKVAEQFFTICQAANVTVTPPKEETKAMWDAKKHQWLGAIYDLKNRQMSLTEKTLKKIRTNWEARSEWTLRHLAAHFSLLFWATRIIKLQVCEKFNAMKTYRWLAQKIQQAADKGNSPSSQADLDAIWETKAKLPKTALRELETWTHEALHNIPATIVKHPMEHTIFVDASRYKWGAVCWDHNTNEVAIISRRWDRTTQQQGMEHSTKAEPLALTRALRTYLEGKPQRTTVRVYTDSITAKAAHSKGYAADYMINSAVRTIKRTLPEVQLEIFHIKGEDNPADAPSRGKSIRTWSAGELAEIANGSGAVATPRDKVKTYCTQHYQENLRPVETESLPRATEGDPSWIASKT